MRLIMHYPKTAEGQHELEKRVAVFHAKLVIDYLNNLPCSYEEKINLLENIKKEIRNSLLTDQKNA